MKLSTEAIVAAAIAVIFAVLSLGGMAATGKLGGKRTDGPKAVAVVRGTLVDKVRGHLFSRASGNFGALDGVIVVRDQPEDMGPVQRSKAGQLESALMSGITATRTPAVGIEATTSEPSSISFFQSNDLSSVDDVDLVAGRLATVYALLGAEGSFGVKSSADRLLPDLLAPHE